MVELKDRGFGWSRDVQAFYCKGGKIRGFKVEGSKHPFTPPFGRPWVGGRNFF